ncbi:MAG TPA: HIT family protein [Polyangiaceae bacterium]|nr:HIT family protein [Polyangiaceae bacterium]
MGSEDPAAVPNCVFCAIVSGSRPAHFVLDRERCVAFLDSRPLFPGHVLLVPRKHVATLVDLGVEDIGPFMQGAQALCAAIERGLGAEGTFVAVNNRVSQSVPHLHMHVVPRSRGDGLRGFFWPRKVYASDLEAASFAERIRAALR